MRNLGLAVAILCAFGMTAAQARTATGYDHGEKTRIKIVAVGGAEAEAKTARAFRAMARAARKDGIRLAIRSGYRSHAKQKALYRKYRHGRGHKAARPGYSNHESGRALDINITDYRVYDWLKHHARDFGFRRTVPGEAWHWEYRGHFEPASATRSHTPARRKRTS